MIEIYEERPCMVSLDEAWPVVRRALRRHLRTFGNHEARDGGIHWWGHPNDGWRYDADVTVAGGSLRVVLRADGSEEKAGRWSDAVFSALQAVGLVGVVFFAWFFDHWQQRLVLWALAAALAFILARGIYRLFVFRHAMPGAVDANLRRVTQERLADAMDDIAKRLPDTASGA